MKKGTALMLAAIMLFISIFTNANLQVYAATENEQIIGVKEKALGWIEANRNSNGSYGDDRIPKDTAQVIKLLRDTKVEYSSTWLEEFAAKISENDSAARIYCALGTGEYFNYIDKQNADGGYGLTASYQSDCLDTVLVFEAMVRKYLTDGSCVQEIQGILSYLDTNQNEDGGFSYGRGMQSNDMLTLRVGMVLSAFERFGQLKCNTDILDNIDKYVAEKMKDIDYLEAFEEYAYSRIYMYLRGDLQDISRLISVLNEMQKDDGSVNNDLNDTIAAVRLTWILEEYYKPYMMLSDMKTELSSYTLYKNQVNPMTVRSQIDYECNYECEAIWRISVFKDTEIIFNEEMIIVLEKDKTNLTIESDIKIDAKQAGEYSIKTELIVDEDIKLMNAENLHLTELTIDDLVLEVQDTVPSEIGLKWNDISNQFYRYGYRLYRSTDGENWETRSSWDGNEKVKVLNIYPNSASRNYLSDWMEQSISGESMPAGKGLFEIDKVCIDDYNKAPDTYLMDEDGYKYDVLVFGTYDGNGNKDLNEVSFAATKRFAESGRGILFGHDTVTANNIVNHPQFARFAEDLGIKLTWDGQNKKIDTVKVVNTGFLTSYPWKLTGVLTIPETHTLGQFTGGSNTATVWMEFTKNNRVDTETGGRDNAYLCTKNQLALIQTGHSKGKATDDERKILANTIFYLKQVTNATEIVDKSALDMQEPSQTEVISVKRNEQRLAVEIVAEDYGTKYFYYVEGLPQGQENEELIRKSRIIETEIVSGIAGYEVVLNDSVESCMDKESGDLVIAEDGRIIIADELIGDALYLHIRAIDNHGNVGEETVIEIPDNDYWIGTEYGLFGKEGVSVYCSSLNVTGDVYSGKDVTYAGSSIRVDGACTAVGNIFAYVGNVQMGDKVVNGTRKEMPDLQNAIIKRIAVSETTERLAIYSTTHIDNPIYCKQVVEAYCPQLIVNNTIVCEGNINLGVDLGVFGKEKEVAIYSKNGDININATTFSGMGVIYAPNGTVTINVSDMKYTGSIIAKRIMIQGTGIQVSAQGNK